MKVLRGPRIGAMLALIRGPRPMVTPSTYLKGKYVTVKTANRLKIK
jgi:hypothetical protein